MANLSQGTNNNNPSFYDFFTPLTNKKTVIIIVFTGFIVYFNALFNGFVYDDLRQLLSNPLYQSITKVIPIFQDHSAGYYRPFATFVDACLYTLVGPIAFWYHLVQIIIHIAITILIYFLFKKFFKPTISLILSLVFLVHPMNVESAAYISSLQTVLSLVLGLVALFLVTNKAIKPFYKYSLISFIILLSALSKETGIFFVVIVICFMKLNNETKFIKKDYYYAVSSFLPMILVYIYLHSFFGGSTNFQNKDTYIPIVSAPIWEKMLTLPKILYYYLFTFIFPKDLAVSQMWLVPVPTLPDFYFPLFIDCLFILTLFTIGTYIARSKSKGIAPFFFFLLWFFLNWSVAWQIIPLDMTVADRWFYVPMIGLLGIIGTVINRIKLTNIIVKQIVIICIISILIVLSVRTIIRNEDWYNGITLFSHDEKISYQSYDLEGQLGYYYLANGAYDKAYPRIINSIHLAPDYSPNWNNLAAYYIDEKETKKSISAFTHVINMNKNYYLGYFNIAFLYYRYENNLDKSSIYLHELLSRDHKDPYYFYFSGYIDYKLGNKKLAMSEVLQAYHLSHNSNYLDIYNLMLNNSKSLPFYTYN